MGRRLFFSLNACLTCSAVSLITLIPVLWTCVLERPSVDVHEVLADCTMISDWALPLTCLVLEMSVVSLSITDLDVDSWNSFSLSLSNSTKLTGEEGLLSAVISVSLDGKSTISGSQVSSISSLVCCFFLTSDHCEALLYLLSLFPIIAFLGTFGLEWKKYHLLYLLLSLICLNLKQRQLFQGFDKQ